MLRLLTAAVLLCGSTAALRAQVVLNEVMGAPNPPEPEWVELYNSGSTPVTVTGWTLHDPGTTIGTLPTATIAAGAFLVVARDTAALRAARGAGIDGVRMVQTTLPSLNNSGELLLLRSSSGTMIDSIDYRSSWGGTGGVSLERVRSDRPNDALNWHSSIDPTGATPGRTNSISLPALDLAIEEAGFENGMIAVVLQNRGTEASSNGTLALFFDADADSTATPNEMLTSTTIPPLNPDTRATVHLAWPRPLVEQGEPAIVAVAAAGDERPANDTSWLTIRAALLDTGVVINEIMFDPLPLEEASGAEYIELHNVNDRAVVLDGWTLLDGSGRIQGTVPMGSPILAAGGYVAIASDTSIYARFVALRESGNVIVLNRSSLGLNSDEDDVVIRNTRAIAVDSVHYHSNWHRSTLGETRGFSLERVSAGSLSNDRRNWSTSAAAPGGTPGERNTLEIDPTTDDAELTAIPATVSPDSDGFEDFTRLSWRLPARTARITAIVYDRNGRVVRWLANNEPAAAEGELIWDGRSDSGRTLGIGPYIIRVEAYDDAGGGVSTGQTVVVVAKRL